jgi:pyruvate dehydrogenase E2 component (dihydrolipoamide acetyltransferase)
MNFELPEIGEGVQEGEIIAWKVKAGDTVKIDQTLVEVMTDKATVELPSPVAGTVKEVKAKEGDRVKVGQVILVIDEGAGASAGQKSQPTSSQAKESAPAQSPKSVEAKQTIPKETVTNVPPTAKVTAPPTSTRTETTASAPYTGNFQIDHASVPASPYVRSLAAKAGVDLRQVKGSGPDVGGVARVLEEDVLKFVDTQGRAATTSAATPQASFSGGGGGLQRVESGIPLRATAQKSVAPTKEIQFPNAQNFNFEEIVERKPLRGLRRVIAQAMVRSKYTAPHFSYVDEFECTSLMALREEMKKSAESYGIKFSYLPFVVKALCAALKEFPQVNASLEEKDGNAEILLKKFYHIGVAVATENGLVVPVVKHADKKSLLQIAYEIQTLSEKTRTGKATSEELKGSTFSITSMGNIGGQFATPIINYPEVAIMGVYKIQQKPIVKDGQIVVGNTMTLSLSCDHRVVDGAVAGYFCNAVIDRLAHPAKLMLEMS